MTRTIVTAFFVMIILSGCGAILSDTAAPASPTIVSLPATATAVPGAPTPAPSSTPSPLPSPTLTLPTATPRPTVPTPTATLIIQAVAATPSTRLPLAATAPAANQSLSGEWDFTFGTMSLTQQNSGLTGIYRWYGGADSGQIRGIILDPLRQFQGLWLSDRNPNSQGFLHWQLAADLAGFTGTFEGDRTGGQWCGVRSGRPLPPGCGFSGVWQLRFGDPPGLTGQATLTQVGPIVRGVYRDSEGHSGEIVQGIITTSLLTEARLAGDWRDDRGGQDSLEWRLDLTTGRTFQGRRQPGNSEWCGWREGAAEPEPCGW